MGILTREYPGSSRQSSLEASPTVRLMAARNTAPPDQVLVPGLSTAEATRVARGIAVNSHRRGGTVRRDRAPAQTAIPP